MKMKLVYIGWINKVILVCTWNSIQYPALHHYGKEYKNNIKIYY